MNNFIAIDYISYDSHNALADADTCAQIVSLCAETVSAKAERTLAIAKVLKSAGLEMKELSI